MKSLYSTIYFLFTEASIIKKQKSVEDVLQKSLVARRKRVKRNSIECTDFFFVFIWKIYSFLTCIMFLCYLYFSFNYIFVNFCDCFTLPFKSHVREYSDNFKFSKWIETSVSSSCIYFWKYICKFPLYKYWFCCKKYQKDAFP